MPESLANRESFSLRWDQRPFTVNAERRMHIMQRANLVKKWRKAFELLARDAALPALEDVHIVITPFLKDRRGLQDVAGCFPAAKAAIDGLVDAGVLEDDNPKFVKFLGFNAPVIGDGDGMAMEIDGVLYLKELTPRKKVVKSKDRTYNNGRKTRTKLDYVEAIRRS